MEHEVGFDEWVEATPDWLRKDPFWESVSYQLRMYLYDLVWLDCLTLRKDFRGREIVGQLVRSAGSICANLEQAYGRGIATADYIRILRIASGEARETHGWYLRARNMFSTDLIDLRLSLINQIISLIVRTISSQRKMLAST